MSTLSIIVALCLSCVKGQVIHVSTAANWATAEADCISKGSHLLTAQGNTADINECLAASSNGGAWIGLSRDNSNTWSWTSNTAYIQNQVNWVGSGAPKSGGQSGDCAVLLTAGSKVGQVSNAGTSCSTTSQYCCDPVASGTPTPTSPTAQPTDPTPQPTGPTEAPTDPTPQPTSPTAQPITPTAPTAPTPQPTDVTASPTTATPAPTGVTAAPTDPPTITSVGCGRERKEWNTASQAERDLYINGLLTLSNNGVLQRFVAQHGEALAEDQAHGTSGFLPWHRLFLYELETQIRNLGGQYECFALLYWNWGLDRDLYGANFDSYSILTSGLGGRGDSSDNNCVTDGAFTKTAYTPFYCPNSWRSSSRPRRCCLRRVTSTSLSTSIYSSLQNENAILADNFYYSAGNAGIKDRIEFGPHGTAHCTMGGCGSGHLGNGLWSPDDPIFFLLHTQVDYMWALWQDYHDYEQVDKSQITTTIYDDDSFNSDIDDVMEFATLAAESWSELDGTATIRDVHSISDMGYRYEYGSFIEDPAINFPTATLNSNWFYKDNNRRRRRRLNEDSMRFDRIAYKQLVTKYGEDEVNTYDGRRKLVRTLAKMSCEYDNSGGYECERPAYYDDCSDMERGPNSYNNKMDIDITLEELIEKVADYPCMVETRKLMYSFVAELGGLWRLCRGDFDRFCDGEFIRKKHKKNQCEARGYSKNKRSESVVFGIGDHNEPQQQPQNEVHGHGMSYWEDKMMDALVNGIVFGVIIFIALFIWICYKQLSAKDKGYEKVQKYIDQENDI